MRGGLHDSHHSWDSWSPLSSLSGLYGPSFCGMIRHRRSLSSLALWTWLDSPVWRHGNAVTASANHPFWASDFFVVSVSSFCASLGRPALHWTWRFHFNYSPSLHSSLVNCKARRRSRSSWSILPDKTFSWTPSWCCFCYSGPESWHFDFALT